MSEYDDDYYEDEYDDDAEGEGDEFGEEEGEFQEVNMRQRLIAIMSTSYGISIVLHIILILILAGIYFYAPLPQKEAVVIAKREVKQQEYDEELKRDMVKTPKIKADKIVEKPIIILEEEVEITKDIPKGTDMSNLSNKNLDSTSVVDAYGVGGGAAGAYGQRWGKGSLSREGGSEGTESAVQAALRWLKRHQSGDGRWDTDGWHNNCKKNTCRPEFSYNGAVWDKGDGRYDEGVSALALLAFLGNGQTHRFGQFKKTVHRGLTWLKGRQKEDGSIGFTEGESIYNHAIATMAMCEAYAVSRDFTLKKYAQKAVDFVTVAQNPGQGWKYGVKPGKNDTSVTGWMVLALKAAKTGKLNAPSEAFDGARNWFDRATSTQGASGYQTPGGGSSYIPAQKGKFDQTPCMTGVALICRIFTGQRKQEDVIKKGQKILMDNIPTWPSKQDTRKVNFYYWYYGTYSMFQVGGSDWKKWNDAMQGAVLDKQRMGGDEDGSWDPVGEWCIAGGRVYATALNALTLEIYYRYERAQK